MVDIRHSKIDFPDYIQYQLICPVCKDTIKIDVQKNLIENTERFPFEYVHIHANPPHGLTLYIDKNWAIRGMEIFKNINVALRDAPLMSKARLIPKKKGKISPMAQQLGIVSKKEFEILQKVDGNHTIEEISKELSQNLEEINSLIQKLIEKGMIEIISKNLK
jgi:hypothetical protein